MHCYMYVSYVHTHNILLQLSSYANSFTLCDSHIYGQHNCVNYKIYYENKLTLASWSKRPNSSFRRRTNSCAVHCEANTVNPTMSAKRMLQTEGVYAWWYSNVLMNLVCQNRKSFFTSISAYCKTLTFRLWYGTCSGRL